MSVELQLGIRKRINMNLKRISMMALAVFAAAMMFAAPLVSTGSADDADAPVLGVNESVNGTYTVFVNDGTSAGWQSQTVSAYDGAQAVQATTFWTENPGSMGARTVIEYGYENLNASYGDITTLMNKTENANNVWNIYVLIGENWVLGQDAIGYYKCFSDYSADWQTANIALEYGADATAVPSSLSTYISEGFIEPTAITQVSGEAFAVQFYLKNNIPIQYNPIISGQIYDINGNIVTAASLADGVTVKGYGSDAYLALKNALNVSNTSNVVGSEAIPSSYSWITTIFGMGTVQTQGQDTPLDWTDDKYAYWNQYNGLYSGTATDVLSPFVLGAYSSLASAPSTQAVFSMVYAVGGV